MIGRDRELDVLTAVVDGARSGSGAVLLVRGEAGIGKSALLDWAAERAARRGMATQRVAGSPAAETAPYVGLARLCAPYAAYVAELPPAQARALDTALQGAPGEAPELAAQGMSNPEIGAELFFSRKTIERRMSAILAKLGLRSRSELPAALARLAASA